jgi:hypothetical protein
MYSENYVSKEVKMSFNLEFRIGSIYHFSSAIYIAENNLYDLLLHPFCDIVNLYFSFKLLTLLVVSCCNFFSHDILKL